MELNFVQKLEVVKYRPYNTNSWGRFSNCIRNKNQMMLISIKFMMSTNWGLFQRFWVMGRHEDFMEYFHG